MRNGRRATTAILATLALAAGPATRPTRAWTSEKYGLSVAHPAAWQQEPGVCGYAILGLRPTVEPDPKKRFRGVRPGTRLVNPIVFIVGTPAPAGAARAEDALDAVVAMLGKSYPGAEFRKPTPATVAGVPGLRLVFDHGEQIPRRCAFVYAVRDGAIVGLELMSARSEFAHNDREAGDVLKTFAWTRDAATTRPATR